MSDGKRWWGALDSCAGTTQGRLASPHWHSLPRVRKRAYSASGAASCGCWPATVYVGSSSELVRRACCGGSFLSPFALTAKLRSSSGCEPGSMIDPPMWPTLPPPFTSVYVQFPRLRLLVWIGGIPVVLVAEPSNDLTQARHSGRGRARAAHAPSVGAVMILFINCVACVVYRRF